MMIDGQFNSHKFLELGCGKINENKSIRDRSTFIDGCIYVDRGLNHQPNVPKTEYYTMDIYEFLSTYNRQDISTVQAYRIFEHQEYACNEIGKLLEMLNCVTVENVILDIIVPNHILIAQKLRLVEEELLMQRTNRSQIGITKLANEILIINTENQNIRHDPHLSTWSPELARHYIESEGTWRVSCLDSQIMYAGRDIYMRIIATKPGIATSRVHHYLDKYPSNKIRTEGI